MGWQELEARIRERTEAIWLEEPKDLRRLRNGVVDSGAGSYGQYFTTLLFAQSEVRGLCFNACTNILMLAQDESFSLDQLKKMARAHFTARVGFLNYVGLHELGTLFNEYFDLFDEIDSREAFVGLTGALKTYGVRLHLWTEHVFPWGLGVHLQQQTEEHVAELLAEVQAGPWTPVKYLTK